MKTTTDALKIMEQMVGSDEGLKRMIEKERIQYNVAGQIQELRTKAKLSQKQLAEKLGTTQSVISRLEDADYDGHSLTMLHRVAAALNKRVEVRFVPQRKPALQPA